MRKFLIAIVSLLLCLLVPHTSVYAKDSASTISIRETRFDLTLHPNEKAKNTVRIDNLSTTPVTITLDIQNFTAKGEQGELAFTKENIPFSLASWITATPSSAVIPAKQSHAFPFVIEPPANASPGDHFAALTFTTVPQNTLTETGITVAQALTSLIVVRIPGDVREHASIQSFTSDKPFYEFGPVHFSLEVTNDGTTYITPRGSIVITDMLGHKTDIPLREYNVLPNASRIIQATWNQHLLIGNYSAKLILSYGSKNTTITRSLSFFAFPLRYGLFIAGILLVIMLLLVFFRKPLRKYVHRLFKKMARLTQ